MKANGVVMRKTEVVEETVRKLRELKGITAAELNANFFLKKGVERALQVSVEAVVDIAHRIVSIEGRPPCSTASKALEAIQSLGVIEDAGAYRPMVQFRNIVVLRYESVDDEIVVGILDRHLDDFDRFIKEIAQYAQR